MYVYKCVDRFNFSAEPFGEDTNDLGLWMLPAIEVQVRQACSIARRADIATRQSAPYWHTFQEQPTGSSSSSSTGLVKIEYTSADQTRCTTNCLMELQTVNNKCSNPKEGSGWTKTRRVASIFIVNHMLKLHYAVNNVRACRDIINALNNLYWAVPPSSKPIPDGLLRKADIVTYKFLSGRTYLLTDNYEAAREALLYACRHCHKDAHDNKRRILDYLVPVQLFFGKCMCVLIAEVA
jgi:hypothetical protein